MCQRSRKPRDAQVCYLWEPPFTPFQPTVVKKLLGLFLLNLHMFCPRYRPPHKPNLKGIAHSPCSLLVIHTLNLVDFIRLFLLILLCNTCTCQENTSANNLLMHGFKQNFGQHQHHLWPICPTNFERFRIKLRKI